ncbi:MAG: hypothetical protein LBN38_05435 [Verrucomicrobiota bacterium]|nr:hypothetical protein [Verrucomicrobiota bacterium]
MGLLVWGGFSLCAFGRNPTVRFFNPKKDALAARQIELRRTQLPERFRQRNNFAWAEAAVEGLEKTEYFAHSGISDASDVSDEMGERLHEISMCMPTQRFEVVCVNRQNEIDGDDCWFRHVDTESKILEDMAARLPEAQAAGHVLLYTDLPPCASCYRVMQQFLDAYPRIEMTVLYRRNR